MMRIIRVILAAVLFLISSYASALLACSPDVTPIVIGDDEFTPFSKVESILIALDNPYQDMYFSESKGGYEICFVMDSLVLNQEEVAELGGFSGSFGVAGSESELFVVGLKLARGSGYSSDQPLFTVTNNSSGKVTLEDIELSNVVDGIATVGTGSVEIRDSIITGDESKSGECILIASDGAIVKSSLISSCGDGVRIAADDVLLGAQDRAGYSAEKNVITGNGIGIHVVSGSENKFAFNNVYGNSLSGSTPEALNAVMIEAGANNGVVMPSIVLDEESGNALRCETDEEGIINKREMWFSTSGAGNITLYVSSTESRQMLSLLDSCAVGEDGKCVLADPIIDGELSDTECSLGGIYVTAMFTGTDSSALLATPLSGIGVIVAPPVTTPSPVPSHLSDGGDEVGIIDDGGSDLDDDDMSDSGGNSMGGDSIGSGMGGMAKCTLTENSQPRAADLAIMIILLLSTIVPMAVVNSMQRAPRRVVRRKDRTE